jgi:hypothetical protein
MSEYMDRKIQEYFMSTRKNPDALMKSPVQYPQDVEDQSKPGMAGPAGGAMPQPGGPQPGAPGAPVPQVGGLNKDALENFDARTGPVPQLTVPPDQERPNGLNNLGKMLSHARAKKTNPQSPTS